MTCKKDNLIPTAGNIGNWILTNVMTMRSYRKSKNAKIYK